MSAQDLSQLGAGFTHEGFGSQAVFRVALNALSHPGQCLTVAHDAQTPQTGQSAAAVLLLALLDSDCTLWVSPSLVGSDAALWLRFHTGCQLVDLAEKAMFVWVGIGDDMPALGTFSQGSDSAPDQSATCILDVTQVRKGLDSALHWKLTGPGIQDATRLAVQGLSDDFLAQWASNHASFPRGVDIFLATQSQLVGLPRTTAIQSLGGI